MKIERVAWVILLVAVGFWGAARKESNTSNPADNPETYSRSKIIGRGLQSKYESNRSRDRSAQPAADETLAARTIHALNRTDPLERMAALLKILESCNKENIELVVAAWKEMETSGMHLTAEGSLLNFRLGQLKGEEALDASFPSTMDSPSLEMHKSCFEGWVQTDPQAATRWLGSLEEGKLRDQLTLSAIATMAKDDPAAAIYQVSVLPEHLRQTAGREVGKRLCETGSIESGSTLLRAFEMQSDAADPSYLEGIFETLLNGAIKGDGDQAIRLVESHLDQPYVRQEALVRATAGKGKIDPVAALEWASAVEETRSDLPVGSLLAASVNEMDFKNLAEAEEWARSRSGTPGVAEMLASVSARKQQIEDRGNDENEYDRDD